MLLSVVYFSARYAEGIGFPFRGFTFVETTVFGMYDAFDVERGNFIQTV